MGANASMQFVSLLASDLSWIFIFRYCFGAGDQLLVYSVWIYYSLQFIHHCVVICSGGGFCVPTESLRESCVKHVSNIAYF